MKQINIKILAIIISILLTITIFFIAFSNIFAFIIYLLWLSFIIFAFVLVKELLTINKIIKNFLYIFIIIILFTGLGLINSLWPMHTNFTETETKIHDQGKVCFYDSECSSNHCIPIDINCKENCTGNCSNKRKDWCIELPEWYYLDNGVVKKEHGFACPAE